jgi:hypothetical protein
MFRGLVGVTEDSYQGQNNQADNGSLTMDYGGIQWTVSDGGSLEGGMLSGYDNIVPVMSHQSVLSSVEMPTQLVQDW